MLKGVSHVISDYGIGAGTVKGEGVHVKIGASPIETDLTIAITSDMNEEAIREKLGDCPLADSCIDSINSGCGIIYALPVSELVFGSISEPSPDEAVKLTGEPYNNHTIVITITVTGAKNEGAFIYTLDNPSADEEITIPLSGKFEIPNSGLTVEFGAETFTAGESFTFQCTEPKMTNQAILDAVAKLRNTGAAFEFVHITGATEKALWAALTAEAEKFFKVYYNPCIFVCETRNIQTGETIDDYVQYLREQKHGIVSRNLQVVSHRLEFARGANIVDINAAAVIMGLHSLAKVQQSIGEVSQFTMNGALSIQPLGIESYTSELDDLGYTTIREYSGMEGIYVNNSRTFAKAGSDYIYTERVRTMYKAVRETRKTALADMHTQIDVSKLESSLQAIVEFINIPIEKMVADKELSSARVIIPEGQDILGSEKLLFKIRAVPIGILREIEIDVGFENPLS